VMTRKKHSNDIVEETSIYQTFFYYQCWFPQTRIEVVKQSYPEIACAFARLYPLILTCDTSTIKEHNLIQHPDPMVISYFGNQRTSFHGRKHLSHFAIPHIKHMESMDAITIAVRHVLQLAVTKRHSVVIIDVPSMAASNTDICCITQHIEKILRSYNGVLNMILLSTPCNNSV
jgi:hypothetical protein